MLIFALVSKGSPAMAGLVIGLRLMIMHLAFGAGASLSGASFNGARSFGSAVFAGGNALAQVCLYLVPTIAGALAGWQVKSRTLDVSFDVFN